MSVCKLIVWMDMYMYICVNDKVNIIYISYSDIKF